MPFFAARFGVGVAVALGLLGCGQEGRTASTSSGSGGAATSSASGPGSGGGGGALPMAKPLSILDWNTHNFVNDKNDSPAPDEAFQTASQYAAQRNAVGAVIAAVDPDIAMLAEVENQAVLDDLDATALDGAYAEKVVSEGNDPRAINIALLSKIPIDEVVSHADDSFTKAGTGGPSYKYARDCLEVHLTFNGRRIVLLGVHFKAKTAPDDPDKRLAEAQHTREIADAIAEKDPEAAIVVLGDFNDLPDSPPYLAVAGEAPDVYTDAAASAASGDQWTFDFQGKLELIDHQMSNPLMFERLDPASVKIRHGADVDAASDHAPVMATYEVN
jgi:endonuclease/exonuclease/phosphatase family metal-dependent hydrolase